MARPKDIGTAGETAVVRYLRTAGFPNAERRALAGVLDQGDITGCPGLVWEVKWGRAAEGAGIGQIDKWMVETDLERFNAGAEYGILVLKRRGYGADRVGLARAFVSLSVVVNLFVDGLVHEPQRTHYDGRVWPITRHADSVLEMRLEVAVGLLRRAGFGDPVTIGSAVTVPDPT